MLVEATAFATIISLLADFKSGRDASSSKDFDIFLEWLIKNNHDDVVNLLEFNTQTTIGIKILLNKNNNVLLDRLSKIDNLLAAIVSNIDGFSDLAQGLKRESVVSDQAVNILRQMEDKQASTILELQIVGAEKTEYIIMDKCGGSIQYEEPRFIEDDLSTLVELHLMRHNLNSKGANQYKITRAASKYINMIDADTREE